MKVRMIMLLFILAAAGSCQNIYVKPTFCFEYPSHLEDDRIVNVKSADEYALLSRAVVEQTFGVDMPQIVVRRKTVRTASIELVGDKAYVDIFVVGEKVSAWHLLLFGMVLPHELTEWLLGVEDFHGGSIYRKDPTVRWIVEGVADFVSAKTLVEARKQGFPLLDRFHPSSKLLEVARDIGISHIQLTGWRIRLDDEPFVRSFARRLLYAGAQYLIAVWVKEAKRKGMERPLLELWRWIQENPGPSYKQLTDWMGIVSGLQIRDMADAVPLDDAKQYYENL